MGTVLYLTLARRASQMSCIIYCVARARPGADGCLLERFEAEFAFSTISFPVGCRFVFQRRPTGKLIVENANSASNLSRRHPSAPGLARATQ